MIAPQKQSKLSEVVKFIQHYEGIINPNRIELIRWLKDAKALRLSNPVAGYMMEGCVYRAQGKIEQASEYMKKAYRLDPFSTNVIVNYASSLSSNGKFDESEELCMKHISTHRANVAMFKILLINTAYTFNKQHLTDAINLFMPTSLEGDQVIEQARKELLDFESMLETLELVNVSIETYKRFNALAQQVRSSYYLGASSTSIDYEINELGTFLLIEESLSNVSIEDCLHMNDDLIEAIIDDDYPFEEYKKIIFNFIPTTKVAEKPTSRLEA